MVARPRRAYAGGAAWAVAASAERKGAMASDMANGQAGVGGVQLSLDAMQ